TPHTKKAGEVSPAGDPNATERISRAEIDAELGRRAAGTDSKRLAAAEHARLTKELSANEPLKADFIYRGVKEDHPGFADALLRQETSPEHVDAALLKLDSLSEELQELAALHNLQDY